MTKENDPLKSSKKSIFKQNSDIPNDLLDNLLLEPSQQLDALKDLIFNSPDTNRSKINFFKEEIKANRYQVEPEIIAAKIMEEQLIMQEEPELA